MVHTVLPDIPTMTGGSGVLISAVGVATGCGAAEQAAANSIKAAVTGNKNAHNLLMLFSFYLTQCNKNCLIMQKSGDQIAPTRFSNYTFPFPDSTEQPLEAR
jgi:hypothetical protein